MQYSIVLAVIWRRYILVWIESSRLWNTYDMAIGVVQLNPMERNILCVVCTTTRWWESCDYSTEIYIVERCKVVVLKHLRNGVFYPLSNGFCVSYNLITSIL